MTPAEKQKFRGFLLVATPAELEQFAKAVEAAILEVVTTCVPHEPVEPLKARVRAYVAGQIAATRDAREAA
ncbi:MAG: hypothetical protein KGM96_15435 [Acidobacteriota bacterium]|nr:hypothetical protein [Xanthomonadaceae bacterium]MDE3188904.1 hypothetical protein [Acidobacteriota bacterium]